MVKYLTILSGLILAISAFVAYKVQGAYQEELAARDAAETSRGDLTNQLEDLQNQLRTTNEEIETASEELVERQEAVAAQIARNDELAADVERKRAEVESQQAQVDQSEQEIGSREELRGLTAKLRAQRAELEELTVELDANQARVNNLTAEAARIESAAEQLRERSSWPSKPISNPDLRTTVRSVYSDWGFVTLNAGDQAGVVAGSTLEVRRGGETVAQLLVTAVERTTAAADIVPEEETGREATVRPGDLVVAAPEASTAGSSSQSAGFAASAPATQVVRSQAPAAAEAAEASAEEEVEDSAAEEAEAADPFAAPAAENTEPAAEDPFGN